MFRFIEDPTIHIIAVAHPMQIFHSHLENHLNGPYRVHPTIQTSANDQMSKSTRVDPDGDFSSGFAAIKWAEPGDCYSTIALLYADEVALRADYTRSAEWRRVYGLRAMSPSASLGKTQWDVPYVDFGWRCYPVGRDSRGRRFAAFERPADRIRVPVLAGGVNRRVGIRGLRRSHELWVHFCLIAAVDSQHLREALSRLRRNTLTGGVGLPPIPLTGLRVFERYIPIAQEVA